MKILSSLIFVFVFCVSCTTNMFEPLKRSLNNRPYGYKAIKDPTGSAPSEIVDKFEVRPGDCAVDVGWSDCANDRERSELKSAVVSGEMWAAWSIFLPADYPVIYPVKTALGQFHRRQGHVVWMFQNQQGGYYVDNQAFGFTTELKKILTDNQMRARWNHILVHVKWSHKNDGFFKVYVNGSDKASYSYSGATKSANNQVYFKYGVYRSFMSRRSGPEPTQIVYYDDVIAARSCSEATNKFNCDEIAGN